MWVGESTARIQGSVPSAVSSTHWGPGNVPPTSRVGLLSVIHLGSGSLFVEGTTLLCSVRLSRQWGNRLGQAWELHGEGLLRPLAALLNTSLSVCLSSVSLSPMCVRSFHLLCSLCDSHFTGTRRPGPRLQLTVPEPALWLRPLTSKPPGGKTETRIAVTVRSTQAPLLLLVSFANWPRPVGFETGLRLPAG